MPWGTVALPCLIFLVVGLIAGFRIKAKKQLSKKDIKKL
jgi:hypothetical protein